MTAPTLVVSRFFNKPDDIAEGVVVDAPPKPRQSAARSRPRATRSVGAATTTVPASVNVADLDGEILDLLDTVTGLDDAPADRPVSQVSSRPPALTKDQQFDCYLGNCAPLMMHARERYGDAGTGGMTTRQVRAWLKINTQYIPAHLQHCDFHVDHIVGDGIGGQNWPLNYFLMPKTANLYFGGWLTIEKRQYVGMPAWTAATNFTTWCSQKSRATLPFGSFDPVSDKFLSKRSR